MAFSKIRFNNTTLIDLTSDTVTAEHLEKNYTAHNSAGNSVLGTLVTGGGGISVDDIATNTQPSGAITLSSSIDTIKDNAFRSKPITSITASGVTNVGQNALNGTQITDINDINFPALGVSTRFIVLLSINSLEHIKLSGKNISLYSGSGALRNNTNLVTAEFPNAAKSVGVSYKYVGNSCFYGCSKLEVADVGFSTSLGQMAFYNATVVNTIVLRHTSVVSLANTNVFTGTPFNNGGTGGTIYIPKVLYDKLGTGDTDDYKVKTNWSTINGYGTITWAKIEGSIYE